MKAVRAIQAILIAIPLVVLAGSANAANVIQDGAFRRSIGIGFNPSTPWNDWTGAGISNSHTAPVSIPGPGNYASIPVGGVLFQRFGTLSNGTYTLSFLAQNQSPWSAQLVFAVQQALGTPVSVVFAAGTGGLLDLPPSSSFLRKTLTFSIGQQPFAANELYFSNSYNSPEPVIANSKNRAGTIINIADVSITADPNAASAQNAPVAKVPQPLQIDNGAMKTPNWIVPVDPTDVVAQVLNYTQFGSDEGLNGWNGGHWRKAADCQYILDADEMNGGGNKINLNNIDPRNVTFQHVPSTVSMSRIKTITTADDEFTFQHNDMLNLARLQRGWELIYSKYCTGKAKAF